MRTATRQAIRSKREPEQSSRKHLVLLGYIYRGRFKQVCLAIERGQKGTMLGVRGLSL